MHPRSTPWLAHSPAAVRRCWLVFAAGLLGAGLGGSVSACGAGEDSGLLSCGAQICTARQTCVREQDELLCRCRVGYAGEQCEVCASGYRASPEGGCEPIPIDCDADPGICGAHGSCIERDDAKDRCRCEERWAGRLCELCADGYQDNDFNESCEPDCAHAALDCESPRTCDDQTGLAVCVCPVGRTGDDCDLCALGYRHNGETCTPTCARLELECAEHEVCVDTGPAAHCECATGYAGSTCSVCAEGYNETLLQGDCLPTCEAGTLDCGEHGRCVDDVGFAYCACEAGWAGVECATCATGHLGETCELCDAGYYRVGDDACQQRCDSGDGCPGELRCLVGPTSISCACPIGYTGPACSECADSFATDSGGNCVAPVPASHTLLSAVLDQGTPALLALDPVTGEAMLVRSVEVGGLAFDPSSETLFAATPDSVATLDLATGNLSPLAEQLAGAPAAPLTYNPGSGELLALAPGAGRPLVRVDVDTGGVTELANTDLPEAFDLAYDAALDHVLIAADALYSMDPSSGAVTTLGPLPQGTHGIAFTANEKLYAVVATTLPPDQASIEACRRSAAALGYAGYTEAPGTAVLAALEEAAVELNSTEQNAQEIISYQASGNSTERLVTISTANSQAVVCVAVADEQARVELSPEAVLAGLIIFSEGATVALELGGATGSADATLVHASGSDALWLLPDDGRVRLYTEAQWADRRVPLTVDPAIPGPGLVHELDPTDASSLAVVAIAADAQPVWATSSWTR